MTLASNKQRMFYSLQDDEIPIYESYTDEEGNVIYITDDDGNKIETGETTIGYTKPVYQDKLCRAEKQRNIVRHGLSEKTDVRVLPKTQVRWMDFEM